MDVELDLDMLVASLQTASRSPDASADVYAIMRSVFRDPLTLQRHMPVFKDNDTILHEDETVSIWHCRFDPGYTVPAHDHQLEAFIGIYSGAEKNELYRRCPDSGIELETVVTLTPGDVLQIKPNDIHAVSCASAEPCCGIHVYLGCLTTVNRSLFDSARGDELRFTDENYERLTHKNLS